MIFELANEKINPINYQFILEWVKTATSSLIAPALETTDAFFSPGDACRNAIIQHIDSATSQLHICVFTISDDSITKAYSRPTRKEIAIKVITDNDKSLDVGIGYRATCPSWRCGKDGYYVQSHASQIYGSR